jgi:hypothetical protein
MADRILDLSKTVYELCKEYPDIPEVLAEAGFHDITRPGMIATAGRFMTIPKGAEMKGIDLGAVKKLFSERGYKIKEDSK